MTELTPADPPPLGHVTAALESGGSDVASLSRVLTGALADALPPGMVEVDYERSMSDRMKGRPGTPVGITVVAGERTLTLRQARGGRPDAAVATMVRGVIISRNPVSVPEWIAILAKSLTDLAEADTAAREALQRLLLG